MASDAAVGQLAQQIADLPPLEKFPNCYPEINPVDVYRSHLATTLHGVTGVDPKIIYPALQWTATLEKGDLVLAIPALRVKGKPNDLGAQWLAKVSLCPLWTEMTTPQTLSGLDRSACMC
jgi:arginyl-tRNA synthetase